MKKLTIKYNFNPKQRLFLQCDRINELFEADDIVDANGRKIKYTSEIVYGGAAGGGKTFIQCFDALRFALEYEGSQQLVIRRTFPELEKNIERTMNAMYPGDDVCKYNKTKHLWTFKNGSIIELGYLAHTQDVYGYQGSEWHAIRIDECTHIPYSSIEYLRTRVRSTDNYPKVMKYSTNPGGIGHMWVKQRFVDNAPPNHAFAGNDKTARLYIPASVYDNKVLMDSDPAYLGRLEALQDEVERERLLHGNWDIVAGAFFSEFTYRDHVVEPFDVIKNKDVKLYRSIDYGLDMLACYWYAVLPKSSVNPHGSIFVYRELCAPDLTISEAARRIREATPPGERIIATYAPPDVLRNRDRTTGRNQGDIFAANGLSLTESSNDRKAGLLAVKEYLQIREGGRPILKIFSTCRNLIKYIPMHMHDDKDYGNTLKEPHYITHSVDSLRYFCVHFRNMNPIREIEDGVKRVVYPGDMLVDYRRATPEEKIQIEKMMGGKPKLT